MPVTLDIKMTLWNINLYDEFAQIALTSNIMAQIPKNNYTNVLVLGDSLSALVTAKQLIYANKRTRYKLNNR